MQSQLSNNFLEVDDAVLESIEPPDASVFRTAAMNH
jgi:hypothetical protein